MLAATFTAFDLTIRTAQAACGPKALLDDVLVTTFPPQGDSPAFVRVAVFDAAVNTSRPHSHHIGHRAVGTARHWFRTERDPLVALNGAAADLFNPHIPADANPLTTAVWADLRRDGDLVEVLRVGRVADGEISVTAAGESRRLLTRPVLTDAAMAAYQAHTRRARASVPAYLANARVWHDYAGTLPRDAWLNPPLGLAATPAPELHEQPILVDTVLLATDGLEIEEAFTAGAPVDLTSRLAHLMTRTPRPGMPHSHGDIAAIQVTPSPVLIHTPSRREAALAV